MRRRYSVRVDDQQRLPSSHLQHLYPVAARHGQKHCTSVLQIFPLLKRIVVVIITTHAFVKRETVPCWKYPIVWQNDYTTNLKKYIIDNIADSLYTTYFVEAFVRVLNNSPILRWKGKPQIGLIATVTDSSHTPIHKSALIIWIICMESGIVARSPAKEVYPSAVGGTNISLS